MMKKQINVIQKEIKTPIPSKKIKQSKKKIKNPN